MKGEKGKEGKETHHRLEADDIHEPIHYLRQRLRHDPRLPADHDLPIHALLPPSTPRFHGRNPCLRRTTVVDVRLGALHDFGAEGDGQVGEAGADVVEEGVEEEDGEGEEED
jgi:hypothetical protein